MNTKLIVIASVLTLSTTVLAGDLNPPAGPVAPTPGPEPRIPINATNTPGDADSLFKITQSGSYYLTGNVTGVAAKHGIEIAISGVSIDLMGYELRGVAGSLDGVSVTVATPKSIEVRNGTVTSWGGDGIDLGTQFSDLCIVERVRAVFNGGKGIFIGEGSQVRGCIAESNQSDGLATRNGSFVIECVANSNIGAGINAQGNCRVTSCACNNNAGNGIQVLVSSAVIACSANQNNLSGIVNSVGAGSILDCNSFGNSNDGILVSSDCLVMRNVCNTNGGGPGGAGIHVTGSDNRIEENMCTDSTRGIDVDAGGNIIVRNTCTGNPTNWDIVAGNSIGPIVVAGVTAGASTGAGPFASTLGSTDPNANYSY